MFGLAETLSGKSRTFDRSEILLSRELSTLIVDPKSLQSFSQFSAVFSEFSRATVSVKTKINFRTRTERNSEENERQSRREAEKVSVAGIKSAGLRSLASFKFQTCSKDDRKS